MDRKVEINNYKERARIGNSFYKKLLGVFLTTAIICLAANTYLYFWLARYEKQSVNGAMTQYIKNIAEGNWDEVYYDDNRYFTELNTQDAVTSYLMYLYAGTKPGGTTFSFADEDDTYRYYDVYYQQNKICTLQVFKPSGSSVWKVRTLISSHTYTFDLVKRTSFKINSTPITSDYISEDEHIPYAYENMGLDEKLPQTIRYSINNFITPPVLQLSDENMISVRDYSGEHYYIGLKPTDEQVEEFTQEIQQTAYAYCKYITEDGTWYDLRRHLYYGTDFYTAISSFDNQWFSTHESIEFENEKVQDIMPLGDDAFTGTISFDYIVKTSTTTKTYQSAYQLFFIKDDYGAWKAVNIVLISDNSQEDQDS